MNTLNRRTFARLVAAGIAAPSLMTLSHARAKLPLSFSTLGCPKWDWQTILQNASKMGFAGIEIRGIQGEMDLTKRPEFAGNAWKKSLDDLKKQGLRVVGLGASTQLHQPDPAKWQEGLDSARKFIELAQNLNCPHVRIFGDKYVQGEEKQKTLDRIVKGLQELGAATKGTRVTVLIESHGDFNQSAVLHDLMQKAGSKGVAILWDVHHTYMFGNEKPSVTWEKIRPYVKHVHLKDSKRKGNDVQYVLFGQGEVPLQEIVGLLSKGGYDGFYSLEWEKGWHAELEEPEVAFPVFVEKMQAFLPSREVTE